MVANGETVGDLTEVKLNNSAELDADLRLDLTTHLYLQISCGIRCRARARGIGPITEPAFHELHVASEAGNWGRHAAGSLSMQRRIHEPLKSKADEIGGTFR